jgi:hypothetical protein
MLSLLYSESFLFTLYLCQYRIIMPRRQSCQHPTRHSIFGRGARGEVSVSSKLLKFLLARYEVTDERINWLCTKCHVFERKKMEDQESMMVVESRTSSDDESISHDSNAEDDKEDEENEYDEEEQEQEDEEDDYMDDDQISAESMDDEPDDDSHDLEYRQSEAMEKLSTIFQLLNITPIHDK